MPDRNPDPNCWNIMIRSQHQAHFQPIWDLGVREADARNWYERRLRSNAYRNVEMQLVTDYSAHYQDIIVPTEEGPEEDSELVITGWIGVENNAERFN